MVEAPADGDAITFDEMVAYLGEAGPHPVQDARAARGGGVAPPQRDAPQGAQVPAARHLRGGPLAVTDALPTPPLNSFASDNAAGVSPEVLDAMVAANTGPALAYGDDPWTAKAEAAIRDLFDAPVETLLCWGGTGANVVGLATVLQPWQSVIAPDTAHIVVDECGAPARFTGSTITPVPHDDGKLRPDALAPFVEWLGSEHHPQPAVVSISQATEMGTVYSVDEIAELCDAAHRHGMLVHLDGARIANAVVATGSDVPRLVRDPGRRPDDLRAHQERRDVRRGGGLPAPRAGRPGRVRPQAGGPALVEDAGSSPPRCWRCSTTTSGSATPATPTRWPSCWRRVWPTSPASRSPAPPRSTRCSPSCPPTSIVAAAGVVVLLGVGPERVAGALDDELRHHRGGRRSVRRRSRPTPRVRVASG